MKTYKIIRYYHPDQNKDSEIIKEGLTLTEAQEHCQDDTSREEGVYFDGYTEE
jgi:hypothetical protein